MNKLFLFCFSIIISFSVLSASAEVQNFSTNKSIYHPDDSIVISGKVNYDPSIPSIILQIVTPSGNGLAHIANIVPKTDGTFSKTIHAGGPTWSENGKYTIKLSYDGNFEKTIDFENLIIQDTSNDSVIVTPKPKTLPSASPIDESSDIFIENPKMRILGFPSFDKSPQYYIDRYNTEPQYQSWFDSQFSEYSIDEVVGYKTTFIDGFPSFDKSPQYYIDRYNTEPQYQSWFDSHFPNKTIYDILGFSTYIPDWIKLYSKNWAAGKISDNEFMTGLNFMLENKILVIHDFVYTSNSIDDVPSWFRNTAHWWANDLISQQEFINSIKYLIQEDIILID